MARDGVAVDARLAAVVARFVGGERMNVAAECASIGVSPKTFYKYAARFRAEGVAGFFPRSRRPRCSPLQLPPAVADAIVRARKELAEHGLDYGATSIGWWLEDHRDRWDGRSVTVPSRATINRVLADRGQLVRHPRRRPRRSYRRFTRTHRNELWQMDGFAHRLADGITAVIVEVIDDRTRMLLACHAGVSESSEVVWAAFTAAADHYGLPQDLLTDNGTAFNGSRRGFTSQLESACRDLGVNPFPSSVAHPQTCGKVERQHQTSQRWLAVQPTAATLAELNHQLDTWQHIYNDRRHQELDGLTPNQAWAIAPASGPCGSPLPHPLRVTHEPISSSGCIPVDGTEIGIGRRHKHHTATVFRNGDHATIFINRSFARELNIDRTRRYQPQR
jgi:Integrase core domain/leucine-zipper of insertion element IS481